MSYCPKFFKDPDRFRYEVFCDFPGFGSFSFYSSDLGEIVDFVTMRTDCCELRVYDRFNSELVFHAATPSDPDVIISGLTG